jgi:hypothetical protein
MDLFASIGGCAMRRISPALVLFFLSPAIAELLTTSTPPVEFFNPLVLFVLAAIYGSSAILIRELTLRWGKRWPTIFTLGLAYGILAEGLVVKSFFDPTWEDLGILGVYGRWAGVNWVWSLMLTVFHAVFSIAIPIFLVEMMCPQRRDESWVGRRGVIGLTTLLSVDVLFGALIMPYRPPIIPYLATIALTIALFLFAKRMPQQWLTSTVGTARRPLVFGFLGLGGTFAYFFIQEMPYEGGPPATFTIAIVLGLIGLLIGAVVWMSGEGTWTEAHKLALVSGALMFFILFAPLFEFHPTPPDNMTGMTLVGITAFHFLVYLWRGLRLRLKEGE